MARKLAVGGNFDACGCAAKHNCGPPLAPDAMENGKLATLARHGCPPGQQALAGKSGPARGQACPVFDHPARAAAALGLLPPAGKNSPLVQQAQVRSKRVVARRHLALAGLLSPPAQRATPEGKGKA